MRIAVVQAWKPLVQTVDYLKNQTRCWEVRTGNWRMLCRVMIITNHYSVEESTESVKKGSEQSFQQQVSCVMSTLLKHLCQMEHLTPAKGLGITENHRDLCANEREKMCLRIGY